MHALKLSPTPVFQTIMQAKHFHSFLPLAKISSNTYYMAGISMVLRVSSTGPISLFPVEI